APPLRPSGRLHRRQHRRGTARGLHRLRPGTARAGAPMIVEIWTGVALIGGVGAVLRFLVDRAVSKRVARPFPFGTLMVNLSGALLLGFLAGLVLSPHVALLAGTAFVGSYTTFSTWML